MKVVRKDFLCEGGHDAKICASSVCFEINDVIEHFGHTLSDYRNFFEYDAKIAKYEAELKLIDEALLTAK